MVLFTLGTFLPAQAQSHFTTLWNFDFGGGAWPEAGLILSSNTLYGTTVLGGGSYATYSYGYGVVFSISTNGTDYADYRFTGGSGGGRPSAGLVLSGNTLYGTTWQGGSSINGTVFAISTDGSDFRILYNFTASEPSGSGFSRTNSDGALPQADLLLSGDTLFGTTSAGGSLGGGTVFAINTDGTGFTNLYNFTDGANPVAGLILSGNTLYGTASGNGINYDGTVFAINTDGTGFTNLYSFTGGSDGGAPYAGLILSGTTLYGTTAGWGYAGNGTVFAINTDGTGFTTLYGFTGGSDGADPQASLILSGGTLYGTTSYGGVSNNGTIFAVNTNGTGFTTLYSFTALSGFGTNSDGVIPNGLILSGNTLYGTTYEGGAHGDGTIFSLSLESASVPLVVTTTLLPDGTNDLIYSQPLMAAGGQPPYIWSLISGLLPPGLALATNGLISGTPLANDTFIIAVRATDALSATATQMLSLIIVSNTTRIVDSRYPTIKITFPKANEETLHGNFTLAGTAHDNVGVASVYYLLNAADWTLASTVDHWTNWTADVTLTPGINTVEAVAVDTDGDATYTRAIRFDYVAFTPLTVETNGNGRVFPDYNGKLLQIGKRYTMDAVPHRGYEFANWTGSLTTTSRILNFIMASNLTFTANFAAKP